MAMILMMQAKAFAEGDEVTAPGEASAMDAEQRSAFCLHG